MTVIPAVCVGKLPKIQQKYDRSHVRRRALPRRTVYIGKHTHVIEIGDYTISSVPAKHVDVKRKASYRTSLISSQDISRQSQWLIMRGYIRLEAPAGGPERGGYGSNGWRLAGANRAREVG